MSNLHALKKIRKSSQNVINPASTGLYALISPYPVVEIVTIDQYKLYIYIWELLAPSNHAALAPTQVVGPKPA